MSFKALEHISRNNYHITIKVVRLNTTNHEVLQYLEKVIEVEWYMNRNKCKTHIKSLIDSPSKQASNAGFVPSACTRSIRHGDFSTICVIKNEALYMSALNICDVPYSVKILSMLNELEASVHTYTSEKFDKKIQITHNTVGGHCGLQLNSFHGHKNNHEKQHVRVDYVCTGSHGGRNMTVLDDSYYTVYGMLCPLSNCSITNSTTTHRTCNQKIYNRDGKKINSLVSTKLEVCESNKITAQVQYSVEGFSKTFSQEMIAMVDMLDNSKRKMLHLGTPSEKLVLYSNNGFLGIDGGEVSLFVHPDEYNSKKFHVMLLRHFPDDKDRFPLMHDDVIITGDANKSCQTKHLSRKDLKVRSKGVQPWLIAVVIVLTILLIVGLALFLKWFRGRQHLYSNADIGLPYHIELEDEGLTSNNYGVEV